MSATAFDNLAPQYDRLWTRTTIGHLQRDAVWRGIAPLFKSGQTVLDLGCGTGEDAVRLTQAGLRVHAIDAAPEMVRIAHDRGVDAEVLPIESCGQLEGSFDAVLSNFGALNCVANLECLREPLARLVRPGGFLIICLIGPFCLWETAWLLLHARPAKAFRRWRSSAMSSLGFRVFYPSKASLQAALDPHFALLNWRGVGFSVPPSYVAGLSDRILQRLDRVDRRIAHWPLLRGLSDHRLFVFVRNAKCL